MHPLHDYIASQIGQYLKDSGVVVLYDRNSEFMPFFMEAGAVGTRGIADVRLGATQAKVLEFSGSFLEARIAVEPLTGGEAPVHTLIYVPGTARDDEGSLLMELELSGAVYRPQLRHLARQVLRKRHTDVQIDEILKSDAIGYDDLAKLASTSVEGGTASILQGLFDNKSDSVAIVTKWLLDDLLDQTVKAKGATPELRKLIATRVGLPLGEDLPLARMRAVTLRHVLGSEFLLDTRAAGTTLPGVQAPSGRDQGDAVRTIASRMRKDAPDRYEILADQVENELGISDLSIAGDALGSIDTFRSEEALVIRHCFDLISARKFAEARSVFDARENSFWIERALNRKTVWQACRLMTDLGIIAGEVKATLSKANGTASLWVDRYTGPEGWHRLDRAQRELETVVRGCEEAIDQRALGIVRQTYEETCSRMAEGFVKALEKAGWSVPGVLPQTAVWAEVVSPKPKRVAYILVDALRFEMGVELSTRLGRIAVEQSLTAALGALPSITPIGMASLQPGAAASFSVVERNGRLGAEIEGVFLPDLKSRQTFAKGRVPGLIDMNLEAVLQATPKALRAKIADAPVVLIRSQEIDEAGEGASSFARIMMAGVIEDLARCLHRLAGAGIEHAVIAADHGHLFSGQDRDESARIDAPGGVTVDLHRRCWIGRGGSTPPGTIRVSASRLGYSSDLDFVFPLGTGVFRAGGDLAYHHGGASLQEMIVPVLSVRLRAESETSADKNALDVKHDAAITNRIFTVRISLGGTLFTTARSVRPVVVAQDRQVATVGMSDIPRQPDGSLNLEPGKTATVGFMLTDEDVKAVRIQVLDGETDAVLYGSKDVPVRLGM